MSSMCACPACCTERSSGRRSWARRWSMSTWVRWRVFPVTSRSSSRTTSSASSPIREWHAIQAAKALAVTWSAGATLPDQNTLYTWMQQQPSADSLTVNSGDTDQTLAQAVRKVSAQYLYPYQMHGSLASSCAVADVQGGTGAQRHGEDLVGHAGSLSPARQRGDGSRNSQGECARHLRRGIGLLWSTGAHASP